MRFRRFAFIVLLAVILSAGPMFGCVLPVTLLQYPHDNAQDYLPITLIWTAFLFFGALIGLIVIFEKYLERGKDTSATSDDESRTP